MKSITSMKSRKILCPICFVLLCVLAVSSCSKSKEVADSQDAVLNVATSQPESVGFLSERLEALHALMQQAVDKKQVSGAVTILARHGKVIDFTDTTFSAGADGRSARSLLRATSSQPHSHLPRVCC